MEDAFEKMKTNGKLNADAVAKWMKDSKLVDDSESSKKKITDLFASAKNKNDIQLAEFKDAMSKFSAQSNVSLADIGAKLNGVASQVSAAAGALVDKIMPK